MTPRIQTGRRLLPIIASLALAACDGDPSQPQPTYCEETSDCDVSGVDLAIVEAAIRFDDDQPFREQVGAHVVEPGDEITVRTLVVNRGSEPVGPLRLRVYEEVRFLELGDAPLETLNPGEERIVDIQFATPTVPVWPDTLVMLIVHIADTSDWGYNDADTYNNFVYSRDELVYHPLVPIISVEWNSPDTVRALEQAMGSVEFRNWSPFVAAPPLEWHMCYVDDGVSCDDGPDGPTINSNAIESGETEIAAAGFLVPATEIGIHNPADEVGAAICAYGGGDWVANRTCVRPWHLLWVRPNLEAACDPEVLTPPDSVAVGPDQVCYIDNNFERWHVAAFDAVAGSEYRLTVAGPTQLQTRVRDDATTEVAMAEGAAPAVFTAPHTRRYYLLTYLGIHGDVPEASISLDAVD